MRRFSYLGAGTSHISLILSIHLLCLYSNRNVESLTLVFPGYLTTTGDQYAYENFSFGDSVNQVISTICGIQIKNESCNQLANYISSAMYGLPYTPSRPTSNLEDYTTARFNLVEYLVKKYRVKKYLEIGCGLRETYNVVSPYVELAYCIDPVPGRGTHEITSDEFFLSNNIVFDMAYVDGYHSAIQVLKDVQSALRFLKPDGLIVLHDCNPKEEIEQVYPREREDINWNGDVWKAVTALRLQDGIEIITVDVDQGVAVLKRRHNCNRLPIKWEMKIIEEGVINALTYEDLVAHRDVFLRLVSLSEMRKWLDSDEVYV